MNIIKTQSGSEVNIKCSFDNHVQCSDAFIELSNKLNVTDVDLSISSILDKITSIVLRFISK